MRDPSFELSELLAEKTWPTKSMTLPKVKTSLRTRPLLDVQWVTVPSEL